MGSKTSSLKIVILGLLGSLALLGVGVSTSKVGVFTSQEAGYSDILEEKRFWLKLRRSRRPNKKSGAKSKGRISNASRKSGKGSKAQQVSRSKVPKRSKRDTYNSEQEEIIKSGANKGSNNKGEARKPRASEAPGLNERGGDLNVAMKHSGGGNGKGTGGMDAEEMARKEQEEFLYEMEQQKKKNKPDYFNTGTFKNIERQESAKAFLYERGRDLNVAMKHSGGGNGKGAGWTDANEMARKEQEEFLYSFYKDYYELYNVNFDDLDPQTKAELLGIGKCKDGERRVVKHKGPGSVKTVQFVCDRGKWVVEVEGITDVWKDKGKKYSFDQGAVRLLRWVRDPNPTSVVIFRSEKVCRKYKSQSGKIIRKCSIISNKNRRK